MAVPTPVDRDQFASWLSDAGVDAPGEAIRTAYQGRGMYGRACVGFVGSWENFHKLLVVITGSGKKEDYDLAWAMAQGLHWDTMGRDDMIFYFPSNIIELAD